MNEDWRALREWLITAKASSKKFADTAHDPSFRAECEARMNAYSAVLDVMDEHERKALR